MEMKHLPIILTAVLSLSCFDEKTLSAGEKEMEITSSGIENGRIEDKYGKRGDNFINNVPSLSLPLIIHNAPPGTKSFALILRDEDAAPVVGYPWIHWLAANIREPQLAENASRRKPDFIQGVNSWNMPFYGGMTPPNAPHRYDLHIYALDRFLPLKNGFTQTELKESMEGHVLDEAVLSGVYDN